MNRALAKVWLQGVSISDSDGTLEGWDDTSASGRSITLTMWLPSIVVAHADNPDYEIPDACSVLDLAEDAVGGEVLSRLKKRMGEDILNVTWGSIQWAVAR